MNRLQPLPPQSSLAADSVAPNTGASIASLSICPDGSSLGPHALFAPLHYSAGYKYPLIVWLHGPNDNEHQLARIMPLVSMRNYTAVAPRGTMNQDDSAAAGFRWSQDPNHIFLAEQRVLDCIDEAQRRHSIATDRIFLGGFQCGGTMAMRIVMNHPGRFAGALTFGGPFPRGMAPLRHLAEARRLPLFIAGGRESRQYAQPRLCADLRLLYAAGLALTLRLYPCGDEMVTNMLEDMNRWIMEQVCPGQEPAETQDS